MRRLGFMVMSVLAAAALLVVGPSDTRAALGEFALVVFDLPEGQVGSGALVDPGREHLYVASTQVDGSAPQSTKMGNKFVMRSTALKAFSLKDGDVIWTSAEAARPLGLSGKYLVARGERVAKKTEKHLNLVVLARTDGTLHCDVQADIPGVQHDGVGDAWNRSLRVQFVEFDGRTYIAWAESSYGDSGAPRARQAPAVVRGGLLRFNPRDCRVGTLPESHFHVRASVRPEHQCEAANKAFPDAQKRICSADGSIAAGRVLRETGNVRWHWTIRSAEGDDLAELSDVQVGDPFVVTEGLLVSRVGAIVSVVDLESGEPVFKASVVPPSYQGSTPP